MQRLLIVLGIVLLAAGLLWPLIRRSGLGRLPGDIMIKSGNGSFYFPIVSCLVVSVALSLILWLINR